MQSKGTRRVTSQGVVRARASEWNRENLDREGGLGGGGGAVVSAVLVGRTAGGESKGEDVSDSSSWFGSSSSNVPIKSSSGT